MDQISCPNCGSHKSSWGCTTRNAGSATDGRLRLSEVVVLFYLGCNDCSETIKILTSDEVVALMNQEAGR